MFKKVSIQLSGDKTLVIETSNNSAENKYVQGAAFNGKSIEECWMNRADLMKGGVLKFEMGAEPNEDWGLGTPPPSMSNE
jgi:putative alpha-1,2-mannosidase